MPDRICPECKEPFPASQHLCPHCGRPSLFPNVYAAQDPQERNLLQDRYSQVCDELARRGDDGVAANFESDIRSNAVPVISMNFGELERLGAADTNVLPTYYQRVQTGIVIPTGDKWDVLRGVAEHALFPGYKDNIRFGALSLDGKGVRNYGNCSVTLKTELVAHRTSLFADNNVVFTVYDRQVTMAGAETLEKGHRATWDDRHMLCMAKLGPELKKSMQPQEFPGLLIKQGETTMDDRFVELHIWGSLTIRSIKVARVRRQENRPPKVLIKDLRRAVARYNVELLEI